MFVVEYYYLSVIERLEEKVKMIIFFMSDVSIDRFCHGMYDRDYKATIGVDFEVEKFSILSVPFNLQM